MTEDRIARAMEWMLVIVLAWFFFMAGYLTADRLHREAEACEAAYKAARTEADSVRVQLIGCDDPGEDR